MRPLDFDPVDRARQHWRQHGWADAAPGMAAVTSVMRAHQILISRVEDVLRPFGLSFARYEVLMLLRFTASGELPLARIGERLQVHPASVTNVVDRLCAQGMIQRRPHPTDRRATLAVITELGRAVAAESTTALNAEVFSQPGLAADDVETLIDLLTELRADAGDFRR